LVATPERRVGAQKPSYPPATKTDIYSRGYGTFTVGAGIVSPVNNWKDTDRRAYLHMELFLIMCPQGILNTRKLRL